MVIKVVVTTLDNLPMLKEQVVVLSRDPLVSEIIVVNNGSQDGTREWLEGQSDLVVVNRENLGAGPGRNAGLDAAGEFDYVLMVDGGIRPLIGGVEAMLDYLDRHPDVDVISPEIATCFTTDTQLAHRRIKSVDDSTTFPQRMLSGTAYCLCRAKAWDGIRFSEEGPFGEPGWGVDDNEMAYRWNHEGILHHDFQGTLLYRRQSGSFVRLFKETGIWPNQYGSVYEKRNVMCAQIWPEYHDPMWMSNNLQVSVVMTVWNEYPMFARAIQRYHDDLNDIPHEIIVVNNGSTDQTKWWLDTFALRWHRKNDCTVDAETGEILRKGERFDLAPVWTGNVIAVNLPENMGTATGGNIAFDKARGKYIFLTDGDILPVKGSVAALYRHMENHPEFDFVGVNAHMCQAEDENPPFRDSYEEGVPRYGMGNYAYGYSLFKREILDAGIRFPEKGPFLGPGCGYTDSDFACQMYEKGFNGWFFNEPAYYHKRRDLERTGHVEGTAEQNLEERRRWLQVKWLDISFEMEYFHNQGEIKRAVRRVAVIGKGFDSIGDVSHCYANALEDICHVDRFEPGEEQEGYDNYIYVGCGGVPMESAELGPSIYLLFDMVYPWQWPHAKPDDLLRQAQTFDRVLCAQPSAAYWLRDQGVDARWLPNAADPAIHKPHEVEKDLDWIALWHNCGERIDLVNHLSQDAPNGWVSYQNGYHYATHMSRAQCSINLARVGETNLRVFETMAIGVPLITSRGTEGLNDLFEEGTHFLGFNDFYECARQVARVNQDPAGAQEMADRARELVLSKHTFYHRILEIGSWLQL